ncbi:ABC-three component system protein, partial [Bacillus sp. JJ1127]|uniref:ABC-three component system protein n=1 Tax=Bacillus sp. JJ1127 TaxID=3122952 RepID=UPI003000A6A8
MSIGIVQKESQYTTDASPSWNGYNHQGKVGIYVALKMINKLNLNFDECKSYELELEWLEDFSIKKNGNYVSIHQVKTYDSTAPSDYKDAIWLILAKLLDFSHIEKGYLHTTKKLSKLDTLKTDLNNYKPPTEKKKEDDTEEDKKKDDTKKKKKKATQKYRTPKECHDYVKGSNRYDEAFSKFEVYTYDDSSQHCDMNEVEQKIKNQLTIIKTDFSTQEHLDRAYLYLLGMVDMNIRERHTDIQSGEKKKKATINFQNIYSIAITNYEISSKEYVIYNLRNRFNKLKDEYLEDLM